MANNPELLPALCILALGCLVILGLGFADHFANKAQAEMLERWQAEARELWYESFEIGARWGREDKTSPAPRGIPLGASPAMRAGYNAARWGRPSPLIVDNLGLATTSKED